MALRNGSKRRNESPEKNAVPQVGLLSVSGCKQLFYGLVIDFELAGVVEFVGGFTDLARRRKFSARLKARDQGK